MPTPITDPAIIDSYLTDASNVHGHAEALVRPRTADEVAEAVAHCQARGIPLTVTAARTSTTAAAVPEGGWLLSTERLVGIGELGPDRVTVGAGVLLGDLQDAVAARGRCFPPDPTSRRECTLGGAIACNASGARSFRYGPIRAWVEAVQVVLPTGEIREVSAGDPVPADIPTPRWVQPAVKTAAGFVPPRSFLDLFVGQEGTLGVVTRATVRLVDPPQQVVAMLAFFGGRPAALELVAEARDRARQDPGGPVAPLSLEYLDRNCLDLVRGRLDAVPSGARAAVLFEQERGEDHLGAWTEALARADALVDDTLVAAEPVTRRRLEELRHAVPVGLNELIVRNGMPKVATDLAVPQAALDRMMDAYEATSMPHALFGHIGDAHLHFNQLPRTPDELARARARALELTRLAISAGGTVSAEHGIGKLKRELLALMVGPETLRSFRRLKRHLDPAWVLGRGNVLEPDAAGVVRPG